jgi:hypothetical protein
MAEAVEEVKPPPTVSEQIQNLLNPTPLSTLRGALEEPQGEILVNIIRPDKSSQPIRLRNMFPFHTLQDIKLALIRELLKEGADADSVLPDYVCLVHQKRREFKLVDFTWRMADAPNDMVLMPDPYDLASGRIPVDDRFVDSNGERRITAEPILRERLTIEDHFIKTSSSAAPRVPTLNAYLYKDLLSAVPGPKPISEKDWNGRLYPFFPTMSVTTDQPTEPQRVRATRIMTIFERRQQFLARLETLVDQEFKEERDPFVRFKLRWIRYLRMVWTKPQEFAGVEALFYELPVTAERPYLRFIPLEGNAISKLFLKADGSPDLPDPKLLANWSQERNPTDRDYMIGKVLLRPQVTNVPALYGSLRLCDDCTADFIIEPIKGVKKLDPSSDLADLGATLEKGLVGLPHLGGQRPNLGNANFVFGLVLQRGDAPITTRVLREKLPVFTSFFQEISPLPNETPLVMLRYKLVSNFVTEDRIFAFLSQVISRKLVKGETHIDDLTALVADEFQMDMASAQKIVAQKLKNQAEIVQVDPEKNEFAPAYNPGIDIAIYGQHPFYTAHISHIDSVENLQRILTALSILFSVSAETLKVSQTATRQLKAAEVVEATAGGGAASAAAEGLLYDDEDAAAEATKAAAAAAQPAFAPGAAAVFDAPGAEEEAADFTDLDFFGDLDGDGMAEAEAEGDVAAAVAAEGAARVEPQAGVAAGEGGLPAPGVAAAATLRREILEEQVGPKADLAGAAFVAAKPVAKAAPPPDEDDERSAAGPTKEGGIANFFIRKLQEADPRLFSYQDAHPSSKLYVSSCQPTYGRQPAVMSEEKFRAMEAEYEDDGVVFQVFPLEEGEEVAGDGVEVYNVLRYGSNPRNPGSQNYYLCSQYFCTRDEILVREHDLYGPGARKMRRGGVTQADGSVKFPEKEPGECPFCRGKVIENRTKPKPGQTILERGVVSERKRHLYIGFLKKTPHPDGWHLPCCFLDEQVIRWNKPAFDKYREMGIKPRAETRETRAPAGGEEGGPAEVPEQPFAAQVEGGFGAPNYQAILGEVARGRYILGAEKFPLEIGIAAGAIAGEPQIGLVLSALEPYFEQDQTTLVSRAFNPQKIRPGGHGFLRIGVENRYRYQADSFLAAVAPYFQKNSAQEMKVWLFGTDDDLWRDSASSNGIIKPAIFMAMNYGNLVPEFYDPRRLPANEDGRRELLVDSSRWAEAYLSVDVTSQNTEEVIRAYMSWKNFIQSMRSTSFRKEYRHLGLLFSQLNMRAGNSNGITFIVLDILKSGKVEVRCPPYGWNATVMKNNDVAFLLHHWSGVWEPLFHIDNRALDMRRGGAPMTLAFQKALAPSWPDVVRRRYDEFTEQCKTSSRGIYTSVTMKSSKAIIPASQGRKALKVEGVAFVGPLRDTYNHIAGLVFNYTGKDGHIVVPVVDDGMLIVEGEMRLNWNDISPAAGPVVKEFYEKIVQPRFPAYKFAANPIRIHSETDKLFFQLTNRLLVPISNDIEGGAAALEAVRKAAEEDPSMKLDELEWEINHSVEMETLGEDVPGEKARMEQREFQEVFEHLRLRFANWLATEEGAGGMRDQINEIISNDKLLLPLFEKRRRMEILLMKTVMDWMTTDQSEKTGKGVESSLLRTDCYLRTEDTCSGRCAWGVGLAPAEGEEKPKRCLLHVPTETKVGDRSVSAARVLFLRLIEELLRFGERRRQLMEQDVSRFVTIDKAIRVGERQEQWILPEKSQQWYELLRQDWTRSVAEEPVFLEEMAKTPEQVAREAAAAPAPPPTAEGDEAAAPSTEPPIELVALMGSDDTKTEALRIYRAPLPDILRIAGATTEEVGVAADTTSLQAINIQAIANKVGANVYLLAKQDGAEWKIIKKRSSAPKVENKKRAIFANLAEGVVLLVLDPSAPDLVPETLVPDALAKKKAF